MHVYSIPFNSKIAEIAYFRSWFETSGFYPYKVAVFPELLLNEGIVLDTLYM